MPGIDTNTKLMLHCKGADASTTIIDQVNRHTVTANGNAQIDTAQKKWGDSSLLFDGAGDYLTIPDSNDFSFFNTTSDTWTLDLWVKINNLSNTVYFYSTGDSAIEVFWLAHNTGAGLQFFYRSAGETKNISGVGEITDNDWHHVLFLVHNNIHAIYLDGSQKGYITRTGTVNFNQTLYVGAFWYNDIGTPTPGFDGWMDEIRIQKSNYFGANPVVGLTDTITVPTSAYAGPRKPQIIITS